jgi:hypothetical protein
MIEETLSRARGVKLVGGASASTSSGKPQDAAVLRVQIVGFASAAGPDAPREGGSTLSLGLEVMDAPEEGRRATYRGHSVASGNGDIQLKLLVQQALRDALGQVLSTRGAADLKSAELVAWLSDPAATDEQRRRAVRILGTRRAKDAVPALDAVLLGDDKELAGQALTAVTNIGDPRSVPAVIRFAENQPALVRKQAIDAVRAMGTREGKAWLFTLSTGHPDAEVQQQAGAALIALEGAEPGAAVAEHTDPSKPPQNATR